MRVLHGGYGVSGSTRGCGPWWFSSSLNSRPQSLDIVIICCNFGTNVITMEKQIFIAWLAGLFEGEGTFGFNGERPTRLSIVSTDEDVLNRVQLYVGGSVNEASRSCKKEHWKQAYIWTLFGKPAIEVAEYILPFLLERRAARGNEWLAAYKAQVDAANKREAVLLDKLSLIRKYRSEGMTHQQIADKLGYERSHISKRLKKFESG